MLGHQVIPTTLKGTDHLDSISILGLLEAIDRDLAISLAESAMTNSDFDIREVGESYLANLLRA